VSREYSLYCLLSKVALPSSRVSSQPERTECPNRLDRPRYVVFASPHGRTMVHDLFGIAKRREKPPHVPSGQPAFPHRPHAADASSFDFAFLLGIQPYWLRVVSRVRGMWVA